MAEERRKPASKSAKPGAKGKGRGNALTRKYGPLPGYAWVAIVAGAGVLIYELFLKGSGSGALASSPAGSGAGSGGGGGTGPQSPFPPYPGPGGSDQPPQPQVTVPGMIPTTTPSSPGGGGKTPSAASQPTPAAHYPSITTLVDHVAPAVQTIVRGTSTSGIPGLTGEGAINPNVYSNHIPVGHSAQNVNPNLAPQIRQFGGRSQPVVQAQTPAEALNQAFLSWLGTHPGGTSAEFSQQLNAAALAARNAAITKASGGSQNVTHTKYVTKITTGAQAKQGVAPQIRAARS